MPNDSNYLKDWFGRGWLQSFLVPLLLIGVGSLWQDRWLHAVMRHRGEEQANPLPADSPIRHWLGGKLRALKLAARGV